MTITTRSSVDSQVTDRIVATVQDYYEGWFTGDADRMRRALHPDLVKRGIAHPTHTLDTDTSTTMIEATESGAGTRHGPERRSLEISINHVHVAIADVHVTGDVYVDYLHLLETDGHWQIINGLWATADTSRLI